MLDTDTTADALPPSVGPALRLLWQLRERGEPVRLTISGAEEVVIAGGELLDDLINLVDRIDTIAVLQDQIRRFREGERGYTLDEVKQELKQRHGSAI